MRSEKGVSLIEGLVVLAIVAVMMAIAIPFSLQQVRRFRAENQIRTMYSNMMEARQRAMQENVPVVVQFAQNGFVVSRWRDGSVDGVFNGAIEAGELQGITNLSLQTLSFPLNGQLGGVAIPANVGLVSGVLQISQRGVLSPTSGAIRLDSTEIIVNPAIRCNCVDVSLTRIGLGKYDPAGAGTCVVR